MDYKILNEEYRIAAAKIPRKTPGISICYSRADVILINDDAAGLDGIVELFATYLDLDDLGRLEVRNYTQDETIRGMLRTMDRIDRVRKHLRKWGGVKGGTNVAKQQRIINPGGYESVRRSKKYGSRPPYMYTSLCPDPRYRIKQPERKKE